MHDITPQQARDQLDLARTATLDDAGDRRVHGLATAGFGVIIGVYVAVQQRLDGTQPWQNVLVAGYALILFALALWQGRAARVVPRRSRLISRLGLALTVVIMLVGIVVLNIREAAREGSALSAGSEHVWVLALAGVLVALPMLAAGALISRGTSR